MKLMTIRENRKIAVTVRGEDGRLVGQVWAGLDSMTYFWEVDIALRQEHANLRIKGVFPPRRVLKSI